MPVIGEQRVEPGLLLVSEQIGAGVQCSAVLVERVVLAAPAAVQFDLDPPAVSTSDSPLEVRGDFKPEKQTHELDPSSLSESHLQE